MCRVVKDMAIKFSSFFSFFCVLSGAEWQSVECGVW